MLDSEKANYRRLLTDLEADRLRAEKDRRELMTGPRSGKVRDDDLSLEQTNADLYSINLTIRRAVENVEVLGIYQEINRNYFTGEKEGGKGYVEPPAAPARKSRLMPQFMGAGKLAAAGAAWLPLVATAPIRGEGFTLEPEASRMLAESGEADIKEGRGEDPGFLESLGYEAAGGLLGGNLLVAPVATAKAVMRGGSKIASLLTGAKLEKGMGVPNFKKAAVSAGESIQKGASKLKEFFKFGSRGEREANSRLLIPDEGRVINQGGPPKKLPDYSGESRAARELVEEAPGADVIRTKRIQGEPGWKGTEPMDRLGPPTPRATQEAIDALEEGRKLSPPYPGSAEGAANALGGKTIPKLMGAGGPKLKEHISKKGVTPEGKPTPLGAFEKATGEVEAAVKSNDPLFRISRTEAGKGMVSHMARPFQTPDFALRKTETGNKLVDILYEADRKGTAYYRSLYYTLKGKALIPTGLTILHDGSPALKTELTKLLYAAERVKGKVTGPDLLKAGFTREASEAFQSIRETLDMRHAQLNTVRAMLQKEGLSDVTFPTVGYVENYLPHTWGGKWEIVLGSKKFLKPDGTSSFRTQPEVESALESILKSNPNAAPYVKFWADREFTKNVPLEKLRFANQVMAKMESLNSYSPQEIKEAVMSTVGKKGTSLVGFMKHMKERKGATGYDKDQLELVLKGYAYQSSKYLATAEARLAAQRILGQAKDFNAKDEHYFREAFDRMAGRPTWDEAKVEQALKLTGLDHFIDPYSVSRGIPSNFRRATTLIKLGFGNVSYAFFNGMAVAQNVYPGLGRFTKDPAAHLIKAVQEFGHNKELRAKLTHEGVIDVQMLEKIPALTRAEGVEHYVMWMGKKTEEWSRGVGAIAAYNVARQEMKMGEKEALAWAHRFVSETIGLYTPAGKPAAFQGIIGGLAGQFKTYMVVMMQNMYRGLEEAYKGDPKMLLRYMTTNVGLAGIYGIIPDSDQIDNFFISTMGVSPKEEVRKQLIAALGPIGEAPLTGLMSVLPEMMGHKEWNQDWTKRVGINHLVPQELTDWLGPGLGALAHSIGDVTTGDYRHAAAQLLPQPLSSMVRMEDDMIIGRRERPSQRVTPQEQKMVVAGFTPQRIQQDYELMERRSKMREHRTNRLKVLIDRLLIYPSDTDAMEEYTSLGGTTGLLIAEHNRKLKTALERQEPLLPKIIRSKEPISLSPDTTKSR